MKCKICDNECNSNDDGDMNVYTCKKCGQYDYQMRYETDTYEDKSNFYKVSSWIREQNDLSGKIPKITNEKFDEILNMRDKKIKEKFDLMIQYFVHVQYVFSYYDEETVEIGNFSDREKAKDYIKLILVKNWIKDFRELVMLFQKAISNNFIDGGIRGGKAIDYRNLTFDGLEYLEEIDEPNKNSKKIFVAFNFDDSLSDIFNTDLKYAIETEGFEYVVVNQNNVEHNKSINDEIIVKLKTSRIVIADFTNHRNSVYFEAGFAMGMNIPIVWTCKKGHENDMSFDTRQFPHIVWEDNNDLVKQVIDRIKRII